MTLNDIEPPK